MDINLGQEGTITTYYRKGVGRRWGYSDFHFLPSTYLLQVAKLLQNQEGKGTGRCNRQGQHPGLKYVRER